MSEWIWLIVSLFCAVLFVGIGVYAMRSQTPVHFWSGSTVAPSEIRDIPAYNKANGIVCILFGIPFLGIGVVGFAGNLDLAAILIGVACFGGMPVLIAAYSFISKQYKKQWYRTAGART